MSSGEKGENSLKLQELDHDNSSAKKHKDASINTTQSELNILKDKENTATISAKSSNSIHTDGAPQQAATPATRANLEPSATVKFVLVPMNQVVTLACSLRMTFKELRQQFATDLKMDPQHLAFSNGKDRKYPKLSST